MEWNHRSEIINFLKTAGPSLSEVRLLTSYAGTLSALEATPHLKKVLLQIYNGHVGIQLRETSREIMARRTDIVIFLKYHPLTSSFAVAAKNLWMDVCTGRTDHWNPTEEEVDSKIIAESGAG